MMLRIVVVLLAVSFILGSCGNDRTPTTAAPSPGQSGRLSFTEQLQTANEFDHLGIFHNRAMVYAIGNIAYYDTVDMTSTAYMMADWLVDYNTTDVYNVVDIPDIGASGDTLFAAFYNWRQGRTVTQCLNDLAVTSYVRSYLSTMVGNVYTMNLSQLLTSYDNTLAAVNADANLDSADKVILKMVIAVGYHSAQLWDNYFANNGSIVSGKAPGVAYIDTTTKRDILAMDLMGAGWGAAAGAFTGTIAGGIFGTVVGAVLTGGPGAPPGFLIGAVHGFWRGAITGAIGGAITGSLYEGVIKPSMDNPGSNPSGGYGAGEGTKKPKHRNP